MDLQARPAPLEFCFANRVPPIVPTQIDSAIRECYIRSRPVYIALPTDVTEMAIRSPDNERLSKQLDLTFPQNDREVELYVIDVILNYLHKSRKPVILVDACVDRHRALKETLEFIIKSGLPCVTAPMGKGLVPEDPAYNWRGVYAGDASHEEVRELVESSDLLITIGSIKSGKRRALVRLR